MFKYGPEKAQYLDAFHAWLFSFYFHVYIFGCLRLTKWLQYIFSVFLKFGAYYITGQWGEFIKQCYLMHLCTFVFHHKICVFIIFISFFDDVTNFCSAACDCMYASYTSFHINFGGKYSQYGGCCELRKFEYCRVCSRPT